MPARGRARWSAVPLPCETGYAALSGLYKGVARVGRRCDGRTFTEMYVQFRRRRMAHMLTYAIGDIHGSDTKLANLL